MNPADASESKAVKVGGKDKPTKRKEKKRT
jgi:hypothetical protein